MMKKSVSEEIVHPIPPFYDQSSRILILGSFPSVKSRESGFFYGHPQNRFWRVLSTVFGESVPETADSFSAAIIALMAVSVIGAGYVISKKKEF